MDEEQIQAIVREAIRAERERIAVIFENSGAEYRRSGGEGDLEFSWEATAEAIAQEIRNGT